MMKAIVTGHSRGLGAAITANLLGRGIAVLGLSRAAALDQTGRLRICSVIPGVIDTDMQVEIRASAPELFPVRERFEALKREGSLSSPTECAQRLIDYLCSEEFGETATANL